MVHAYTHLCIPYTPTYHFFSYFITAFSFFFLASLLHNWCTCFAYPIRYGPRNGSGQVAYSDFIPVLAVGDPEDGRG